MKATSNVGLTAGLLLAIHFLVTTQAQNIPVVHWINDSGQHADTVLNSGAVFVTSFKGTNDLKVTPLTSNPVNNSSFLDKFGGESPGNNQSWVTRFVGAAGDGTGDGVAGDIQDLEMSGETTGSRVVSRCERNSGGH
jgi:hypothetical protein